MWSGLVQEFINSYETKYGAKPPVDVWAIDAYPLDWDRTPNSGIHAQIVIDQLKGMRTYLNSMPEYRQTPIWITEIALHVGYEDWTTGPTGLVPVGNYQWSDMSDYLITVVEWLEANAAAYQIDRWFFFATWKDIVNVGNDGYMGIILFDGPEWGAEINCLGEIYRAYSKNLNPLKCDAEGNTISLGQ